MIEREQLAPGTSGRDALALSGIALLSVGATLRAEKILGSVRSFLALPLIMLGIGFRMVFIASEPIFATRFVSAKSIRGRNVWVRPRGNG